MDEQTLSDIQGFVLFAYRRLPRSYYLVLHLGAGPEVARDWLDRIRRDVSGSARREQGATRRVHVAFTRSGLERLGVPAEDVAAAFPREFVLGMNDPDRSKVLGDQNDDAPDKWEFGKPGGKSVDALLLLFGTAESIAQLVAEHQNLLRDHGIDVIASHDTYRPDDGREHFGFHDGISQPYIKGSARPPRPGEHPLEPGEFILGHTNEYGRSAACPTLDARLDVPSLLRAPAGKVRLGLNGSYLVYRKMEQDVEAFWRYAFQTARPEGTDTVERAAVRLASRFVGRWPGGAPLVLSPDRDREDLSDANRFAYRELDPLGHRCPLGAHIRRGHPRDMLGTSASHSLTASSRHRILRRGRLYGPRLDDVQVRTLEGELVGFRPPGRVESNDKRGLIFIALNADLRRQFEFVQQTWVNAHQFGGVYDERDPLVGADVRSFHDLMSGEDIPCARNFTLQGEPVRTRRFDLPRFTRIRGGAYFFLPGRAALQYLAGAGSEQT